MSVQKFKNWGHLRLLFNKPGEFWKKIQNKYRLIANELIIDKTTARFIEHNRKVWKDWVNTHSTKVVLVDWNILPAWNVLGLFFANVLARKKGARICSFAREQWAWAHSNNTIFRSFNVMEHIVTSKLSNDQRQRLNKMYDDVVAKLKTKEDVFNLKIDGVHIGEDIYESYLREFSKPTVYLDEALFSVVHLAVTYLIFWEDYFKEHEVAGVVISHDSYVDYNILCRVAYKRKVPVYYPVESSVTYLKKPHDSRAYFYSYKKWFEHLTEQEKAQSLALAKKQLEKRFKGEVGDLHYASASAFNFKGDMPRVVQPSDKIKILICSHCFYDNPHGYGGMIFIDFYEWLKYLVMIAEKTDYDWYLKTHPNPLAGTAEIIDEILGASSRIKIVPSDTSHHQLAKEGINFVLTAYGTVGHEYPALGVQVINAAYNPHVGYDFTWTPKNKAEYENFLLNLKELKKEIKMDEIYEFYFMHYYYCIVDDVFYHSIREEVLKWTREQHISSNAYAFYMNGWSEKKHHERIARLEEFIDSGKQYLLLKGPVDLEESSPLGAVYIN